MLNRLYDKFISNGINRYTILKGIIFIVGIAWIMIDASYTIISIIEQCFGISILTNGNGKGVIIISAFSAVLLLSYCLVGFFAHKYHKDLQNSKNLLVTEREQSQFYRYIVYNYIESMKDDTEALFKSVKDAENNKEWDKAVKLCEFGSRVCHMLSRQDLKIQFGKRMLAIAENFDDKRTRDTVKAVAKIDCIGWPKVIEGDTKLAKSCIEEGIQLLDNKDYIMRGKAQRHLAGIYIRNKEISRAEEHAEKFYKCIKKMHGRDKKIMKASWYMLKGDICLANKETQKANGYYEKSYKLHMKCDDLERAVKLRNKLGKSHERMGEERIAMQQFVIGYWEAKSIARVDEEKKNIKDIHILNDKFSKEYNEDFRSSLLNHVLARPDYFKELTAKNIYYKENEEYYNALYESLYNEKKRSKKEFFLRFNKPIHRN